MEKKAQALKGRTIAVDSINSVVHSFLRFVARKGGVDPDRDIKVTSMQGPAALAAIKTGAIDGFTMSSAVATDPRARGNAIRLVSGPRGDFPELQPFAYIAIVARPDYCEKNVSICKRVVAGLAKSLAYIREHPQESMAILKKRIPSDMDPAVFEESFKLVVASTPASPRVDEASMARAQDYMIATGMMKEEERLPSLAAVIDNKYLP